MTEKKITLIYCLHGRENPCWAAVGTASIGPKYLHFRWLDSGYREKYDKDKCIIIDGWHEEVVRQVEEWQKADREHWQKRNDYRNELQRKLQDIVWREMENWDKQNPPPKFIYRVQEAFKC